MVERSADKVAVANRVADHLVDILVNANTCKVLAWVLSEKACDEE